MGRGGQPELPESAHQDDKGNFYIDAPVDKGGTAPILDATLDEQLERPVDKNSSALQARVAGESEGTGFGQSS